MNAKNQTRSLFPELEQELAAFHTTGILPSQTIEELIASGHVTASVPIDEQQVQPASLDLRLGPIAYRVRASFLPRSGSSVLDKLQGLSCHEIDLSRPAVLEAGCVYIVPLIEQFNLPPQLAGKGNPKSTTGRLDVFTRLLTDYGEEFDRIPPGYKGKVYLEVAPKSFSVIVRETTRMYQMRFVKGNPRPSDVNLRELDEQGSLVLADDGPREAVIDRGLRISADLVGHGGAEPIGYRARRNAPAIDLEKTNYYEPLDFWEPIFRPKGDRIILDPMDFHLLISKERICVRPDFAAELVPFDPSMGEFRIHYAGFFDPGFGYATGDIGGARAVLEVRVYGVPFALEDGQIIGRLIYERLQTLPRKIYGAEIGSSYQGQELSLSRQFKRFGA
jgi:dCTP deaminase